MDLVSAGELNGFCQGGVGVWGRRRRRSSTRPAAFEFSHTRPQNKRQIREQLYSRLEEVERHYNARQLPRLTLLNMLRLCARPVTLLLFVPFLRVLSHRSARSGLLPRTSSLTSPHAD